MKITVDTNVLISTTFLFGASYNLFQKIENKEVRLIISKEILEEYIKVLKSEYIQLKVKDKNLVYLYTLQNLIALSEIIVVKSRFDVVKEDPDDNKILECAFDGDVDYIVSKDKHLLKLKEFKGIKIIKPEEALKLV